MIVERTFREMKTEKNFQKGATIFPGWRGRRWRSQQGG
jgi:hypothetical protein